MKRNAICLCLACMIMTTPVFAAEQYTVDAPSAGIFALEKNIKL